MHGYSTWKDGDAEPPPERQRPLPDFQKVDEPVAPEPFIEKDLTDDDE